MKLEAVDRMNPSLVCVASVTDVVDSRFLVHFDNWDDTYDYWYWEVPDLACGGTGWLGTTTCLSGVMGQDSDLAQGGAQLAILWI